MNRYLVFGGWDYENAGGGNDFICAENDLEKAKEKAIEWKEKRGWTHIFDTVSLKVVSEYDY